MIVVGIELPVEEVTGGSDAKRVAEDRSSAMWGGPQLYNLRTEKDRLVVSILCTVIESNLYSHPPSYGASLECFTHSRRLREAREGAKRLAEAAAVKLP